MPTSMGRAFISLGHVVGALALIGTSGFAAETGVTKPNLIFVLVDDMGWTDLGCMGSTFYETPHIDRLASQGMRFTQAYSACTVCSPTRAAVLTGKYPARLHITDWITGHVRPHAKLRVPDWTMYLSPEETTIADALRKAGYATASIGKWHLGGEKFYPDRHGFDLNIGGTDKGSPLSYFAPYRIPTLPEGPAGEFLSDRLTTEALTFIERNQDRPFFLYLPHYAVHTPLMAKPEVIEKYKKKIRPDAPHQHPVYAGLVESVDDSVGRIMKKLEALKLSENTILFFTSDNGGLLRSTSNVPLRAGKGSAYEGGVRVPLIIRWPGVTRPGSTCDVPVISTDFFPTLLAMAGAKDDSQRAVDGESLVPLLRQSGSLRRDAIYWHYPHYHPGGAIPYSAIRRGDFRLIEFFEDNHIELYDLKNDIGEKEDLAAKMPEKAEQLRSRLAAWRNEVGAQLPSSNPDYDPARMDDGPARPRKQNEQDRK